MNTHRIRWRLLLALAVVVLGMHLLLLGGASGIFRTAGSTSQRVLITRTIEAPSPPVEPLARPALASALPSAPAARTARPVRAVPAPAAITTVAEPAVVPAPAVAPVATAAQPAVPLNIPGSVRLHYEVTAKARGLTLQGTGELHWRHDGNSYEARLEVRSPFLPTRRQTSSGRVTAEGLAPVRFSDKARNEEAAHFDRDKGVVSFSSNRPDAPLMAGAQDRLSVLLQLGAMIAGAPQKFPPASTIAVQTASTRDAEPWHFTVEGEEQLQLPGGTMGTLKLTRNPRKEFDQKVELWLSPSMDYVPVRLRLTHPNGDWVDQQWSSTDKG